MMQSIRIIIQRNYPFINQNTFGVSQHELLNRLEKNIFIFLIIPNINPVIHFVSIYFWHIFYTSFYINISDYK